jgi:predicted permease
MRVSLPETRYDAADKTIPFFSSALDRIRALPGVEAAGGIDDLPLLGGSQQPIVPEGRAELLPKDQPTVAVRKITPGYLRAMQIPMMRGRDVTTSDSEVMLVSESAAKLLWADGDPVGRRVTLPLQSRTVTKEVIGIVGDVKQGELSEPTVPTVYEFTRVHAPGNLTLVVRTSVPPMSVAKPAGDVVRSIDPEQPVEDIRTMETVLNETLGSQRFSAMLLGMFAMLALTLASVGIYSVLSYIVRGRSREIGIRTALGASTRDVVRLILIEGMSPALMGIAAGVVASLASATLLQKVVFGVNAWDPLMLTAVAGSLALIAFLATLIPAYRASRVDPLTVLRGN